MKHFRFQLHSSILHLSSGLTAKTIAFLLFSLGFQSLFAQKENFFCNISANIQINCQGVSVSFDAFTPQGGTRTWNFGDGSAPVTAQTPTHTYVDVNPFLSPVTVTMTTSNGDVCTKEIPFPGIFVGSGCGSSRTVSALISANKLPANELAGKTLYVFGNLIVDVPYRFNNCNIFVSTGGKIIVNSGGVLTLDNNTVADVLFLSGNAGCQSMWNGIEVLSGSSLLTTNATIQNAYFGINANNPTNAFPWPMVKLTNTQFKRNFIGFYAANGGCKVLGFSDNTFEGSWNTSIYPASTCNPPTPVNGIPYVQKTYCGVYFDGSLGGILVLFGANNTFKDLQAGVVCLNGSATVKGCKFERIRMLQGNSAPYQATALTFIDNMGGKSLVVVGLGKNGPASVSACERGYYARTSKFGTKVNIAQCRMEEVQNGVELEEGMSGAVLGNFFTGTISNCYVGCTNYNPNLKISSTGISVKDPNVSKSGFFINDNDIVLDQIEAVYPMSVPDIVPTGISVVAMHSQASSSAMTLDITNNTIDVINGQHGILVENVANAQITDNTVDIVTTSLYTYRAIGVTGGVANTVSCNDLSAAPQNNLEQYGGVVCEATPNVVVEKNTTTDLFSGIAFFNDCETSCYVGYNDLLSVSNPNTAGITYFNSQTGPQDLRGNVWTGDFFGGALYSAPASFPYCNSQYFVSSIANVANATNPAVVANNTQMQNCNGVPGIDPWFVVEEVGEDHQSCGGTPGGGGGNNTPVKNQADLNLAGGGSLTLSQGYKWSAEMGVYRKFTENPGLATGDPVIQAFMQTQLSKPVSAMYEVRQGLYGIDAVVSAALKTNIQNTLAQLETNQNDLLTLLENYETNPTAASTYTNLVTQAAALEQQLQSYLASAISALTAGASNTSTRNNNVNCTDLPCTSERFINDLYLQTQYISPRALTAGELASVLGIAMNCPSEAGNIVYSARAWYYIQTGIMVDAPCGDFAPVDTAQENSITARTHTGSDLVLMPNPADNLLNIVLPETMGDAVLRISDLWGRLILEQNIAASENNTSITISTGNLVNGNYLVSLVGKSGKPVSKMLTILH